MYSGADGLEVPGASKGGENLRLASTGDSNTKKINRCRKTRNYIPAGNTGYGANANAIKDSNIPTKC